ncbi:MAG: hypothetical protein NT027_11700 [Proteobacteria bacterium]|nr:hypothetical protein [Pseudomonadota bacterium]
MSFRRIASIVMAMIAYSSCVIKTPMHEKEAFADLDIDPDAVALPAEGNLPKLAAASGDDTSFVPRGPSNSSMPTLSEVPPKIELAEKEQPSRRAIPKVAESSIPSGESIPVSTLERSTLPNVPPQVVESSKVNPSEESHSNSQSRNSDRVDVASVQSGSAVEDKPQEELQNNNQIVENSAKKGVVNDASIVVQETSSSSVPEGVTTEIGTGKEIRFIKAEKLHIRVEPNRYSRSIGIVTGGAKVHVDIDGDWAKLEEGKYIRSRWLVKALPKQFKNLAKSSSHSSSIE